MNDQQVIIESLALDLKRVAVGLQRGSTRMAERFKVEALRREDELEKLVSDRYLHVIITGSRKSLLANSANTPEDALMYSTLLQNFTQKHFP